MRCLDAEATKAMVDEINVLRKKNESIGGIFELRAYGLVPGLGSHVSWEQRLDGLIAGALLSIQARQGRRARRRVRPRGPARLGGPRRDLLLRGARLLPRDQPQRRHRGRHDDGRAAGRARGHEADPDADQAAALGRHRHARSPRRRCASGPTPASCPPRASWGRRCSRSCWPARTGTSSAATTSMT